MDERPKVIRDGKVAILYSPGYGAGWYSWIGIKECLTDPTIVALVEEKNTATTEAGRHLAIINEIERLAESKWPNHYYDGARDLKIYWLEADTVFRIEEYDGSERVVTGDNCEWIIP